MSWTSVGLETVPKQNGRIGISLWQLGERFRVPLLIWIGSLAIYLPGVWWGLPYATSAEVIHGWDVDSVSGMIVLAEFHNLLVQAKPDWWVAYPLFHYIVLGLVYAPYLAYLFLSGGLSSPSAEYPYGLSDPAGALATLALIGRLVTTMMASGAVVAVYLTGKTVWGRGTGILAAVTMSVVSPMFYYARTGNLDIPVLFWMSLATLVMAKSVTTGLTVRRGIWMGTFAALAVATKDQAYGALVPGLALLTLFHYRHSVPTAIRGSRGWTAPLVMIVSGSLAYVLASGFLLSPQRFFLHIQYVLNFRKTFYTVLRPDGQVLYGFGGNVLHPSTPAGYSNLAFDVGEAVIEALGPVAVIIALVGLFFTWRSSLFTKVLFAMGLGHVVFVILPIMHMQYRYAVFVGFVAAFFIARGLVLSWRGAAMTKALALGAAILTYGWLGAKGVDLTYQMLFDARLEAARCLASYLRSGDQVGFFGGVNQLPALPSGVTSVRMPEDSLGLEVLEQKRVRFVLVSPDAWSDAGMDRSWFLAPTVYERLEDGSLGYQRLATFQTQPLLRRPLRYLPIVNPTVQVFGSANDSLAVAELSCRYSR